MHYIKLLIASGVSIVALFIVMIFFQNGNSIVVAMNSSTTDTLQPQVYFADKENAYTENNSRRAFRVKNNKYHFSLPELKAIKYIRFDPANSEENITIDSIEIIQHNWFKITIFELPIDSLKPLNQIKNYKKIKESISFSTLQNDSQFDASFKLKHISTSRNIHLSLFLLSILLFTVCFYLYRVYKTEELNNLLTTKLILYSLFFALALFKVDYYKEHIKVGYPPDEVAHLAYIDYVYHHSEAIPKFEEMVIFEKENGGNYLSHPPLYYKIMSTIYSETSSIQKNISNFRELNMIIFLASFLLLLYMGFSSKITLLGHFVYLSLISSVPMFAYLGGSITNDNLAIFGALVFILGLKRLLENRYTNLTFFIIGIGIFIAYFSKLTAAILIFFALVFFLIYAIKRRDRFTITKMQIGFLILFLLPIVYYQLYILITYHSILPSFNVTNPEQYLKSSFFTPEQDRIHLTPLEWLGRMKEYVLGGWFGIHSHHSLEKNSLFEYIGLLTLHVLAIAALFFKCKKSDKTYCIIGKIGLLALFAVMVIQYIFSYKTHLNSGYMGGLQPRYLLPFMFSFAIMASIFVERFKHIFLFTIFIILVCIHAIYSDFFYFLNYYS